jgi:hypothetical protein
VKKYWLYIAAGVVLLYLFTRKAAPAQTGGGGGANNQGVNADMGGADFGVTDPSTWD